MGFNFSVRASAIFGVEIVIPDDLDWSKFAKRLEEFEPSVMACHDDEDDDDDDCSESGDDMDEDDAKWEFDFNLAGQKALDKILGNGQHGLELRFCLDEGAYGEANYPATIDKIFLFHSASEIVSQKKETEANNGYFNAPFGCLSTPIPIKLENHDEIVSSIEKVLTKLGLETEIKPGWQFVTVVWGG